MGEFITVTDCEKKHKADEEWRKEIRGALKELTDRLYKDNGHVSIQTRLDRGDRILGILCWITTVAGGTIIVAAVAFVWKIIAHVGA